MFSNEYSGLLPRDNNVHAIFDSVLSQHKKLPGRQLPGRPLDIFALIEDAEDIMLFQGMKSDYADGAFYKAKQGFVIYINPDLPTRKQRYVAAYELAHYFLHGDVLEKTGGTRDVLFMPSGGGTESRHRLGTDLLSRHLTEQQEAQADKMALDILMPLDKVHELIRGRKESSANVLMIADTFDVPWTRIMRHYRDGIPPLD